MTQVKCSVQNCHYWGRGEVCEADRIEVAVVGSAGARMDAGRMETAARDRAEAGRRAAGAARVDAGRTPATAAHSEETCCVTFRPREQARGRQA